MFGIGTTEKEQKELEKAQRANTGEAGASKARTLGEIAAQASGANAGQSTAQMASTAGATKGQAESLAGNASNAATNAAIAGKTEEAAKANQEEIANKEKQLQEAEAEQAEKLATVDKIGAGLNTAGTAGLTALGTAFGGPVGGAIGAGIGGLVGAGRSALMGSWGNSNNKVKRSIGQIGGLLLSDERCKELDERCGYKSKIKKDVLLHLLENVIDESADNQ